MPWNPDAYRQFSARDAPFDDLAALIAVRAGQRVIDLGCGSGELTARLAALLPGSDVLGIDSSPEMLARARAHERAGLRFALASMEDAAGEWDLVFSHAALQWVPDHAALLPRWLATLRPGGQIVLQMASDHDLPGRVLLRDTAADAPFARALDGWRRPAHVLPLHDYAGLLFAAGAESMTVFEKVYPSVLADADALVAWYQGTALVPYLERLPADLREPFVERFRTRVRARWRDGPLLMPSKRIVLAATLPGDE